MENVPSEVLKYEILMRLPETAVLRFMFTCKEYFTLVSSVPEFARRHRRQRGRKKVLILDNHRPLSLDCNSLLTNSLELPTTTEYRDDVVVMGSCRGLICLCFGSNNTLVLWNPTTREFNKLPMLLCPASLQFKIFGFGYDTELDDYKIVTGIHQDRKLGRFMTYSLRSHSVKHTLVAPSVDPHDRCALYFAGHLHWLSKAKYSIITYDLRRDSTSYIFLPNTLRVLHHTLHPHGITVINDSLSIFCGTPGRRVLEVWIMKVYGMGSSWTKAYKFVSDQPRLSMYQFLCSRQDNEFLVDTSRNVSGISVPSNKGLGTRLRVCKLNPEAETNFDYSLAFDYSGDNVRSWTTYEESLVSPHSGGVSLDQFAMMRDWTGQSSHGYGYHARYRMFLPSVMMSPARVQIPSCRRKRRWDVDERDYAGSRMFLRSPARIQITSHTRKRRWDV